MKTLRYLFLVLIMSLFGISNAQQRNVLRVPDMTVKTGKVQLPVNIENTDEIAGAQFDITLPAGITAETAGTLSNRGNGHSVSVNKISNGNYRVLLHSAQNKTVLGQSGVMMYLPIFIPTSFEEGSEYPIVISNAVLGKASGENVLTEAISGKIRIAKMPDLVVNKVTCDKQEFAPGEHIFCSWQVGNIGEIATSGGWSEQISLVSEDGSLSKIVATTNYDGILEANGTVSRQAEISLPYLLGIDGPVRVQVQIVSTSKTGEIASAQGNNTKQTDESVTVKKSLIIEISPNSINEEDPARIALLLTRTGNWNTKETFNLSASADSRISLPESITIPANQSGTAVYFNVKDNDVVDDNQTVHISVSGNNYPEIESSLDIIDNEYPSLHLEASKKEITEGETFQLTISTDHVSGQPTTVSISSENNRRFIFPSSVVIPVGETSATIEVSTVDDDEIEAKESLALYASADSFEKGIYFVTLNDNDLPTLSFSLLPEAVSESDGYAALFGVIKRTDNLDKKVTLKLFDDSEGLLTYSYPTIVLEKNQSEAQFNIGVTDNELVNGNHVVNVTASVYASSCNCSVTDETNNTLKATVTVIDDDGPTLKIKPAGTALLEGSESNIFIVSHNVESDKDITVSIVSDKDDRLEYNHNLTIPAGQMSTELVVKVKSNDVNDDNSIAAFKAESDNFSMGTCWILITDQTLPDATITLSSEKNEAEAEECVILHAVIKNVGNSVLPKTTPFEISFSGSKETINLTIGQSVEVGDSAIIDYKYGLPALTGSYVFEATVNAKGNVPELIYANNKSEKVGITLKSPFSITAKANKKIYLQNDSIYISGLATGKSGNNAPIDVYFINNGYRQTISTTTDKTGNYSVAWKPLSKQSGHFIVGACYPGAKTSEEMDAFDVYGIQSEKYFKTCELSQTETISGKIIISNPGNLSQTGLKVTPSTTSNNCEFSFDMPNRILAGESAEITYTIKANEISEGRDWQKFPIKISTAEGSIIDYVLYYYVLPLKAKLQADNTDIQTTMTYGIPREYPITIRNVGRTETGKITLALPNWIQAATPNEMASLAQGDSATILLRFLPTEDMKLNVKVSGRIGVNCENGDGTAIRFNLTPVSEAKGRIRVNVEDEYTFFTEEAPRVSEAKVQVINPSTNEVIAEGVTNDNGTFYAEIPEGYYTINIKANKHDSYSSTIVIDPGEEKVINVFISYQAITYSWDVEETSVEDVYEIETIVKYETRVPKPVVIITLPDYQPDPNSIIPVIVTNMGLVNAVDVNMSLSIDNGYTLEFLNEPTLDILAPKQSYVFYAKMKPEQNEIANAPMRRVINNNTQCYTLIAEAKYKELCLKYTGEELAKAIKKWGIRSCLSSTTSSQNTHYSNNDPGHPSLYGKSNYDSYYKIYDTDNPAKFCDPKLKYILVSNDESESKMKGVAADGVSQVKIILDKNSEIPQENSGYKYSWRLDKQIGKLSNTNSLNNIVYTAPYDFPGESNSNTFKVKAILEYTTPDNQTDSIFVPIEVVRVPIVLLHGLADDYTCWEKMASELWNKKMYEPFMVMLKDYKNTNCNHFTDNINVASDRIEEAIKRYRKRQYIASKADLVGHSMGGILSRLHVQYVNNENVHKLITVNTPHSGSEWGDLMQQTKFCDFLIEHGITKKFKLLNSFVSTDAIYDLGVNSKQIDDYLNNTSRFPKMNGIPIHSITTIDADIANITSIPIHGIAEIWDCLWHLSVLLEYTNLAKEIEFALAISDDIVSAESQDGGLSGSFNTRFVGDALNNFHSISPKSKNVINAIESLLQESVFSEKFCFNGFSPVDRKLNFTTNNVKGTRKISNSQSMEESNLQLSIEGDSLVVNLDVQETDIIGKATMVSFANEMSMSGSNSFKVFIPNTHSGEITVTSIIRNSDNSISHCSKSIDYGISRSTPKSISCDFPIEMSINDTLQYQVKVIWNDGTETFDTPDNIISQKNIIKLSNGNIVGLMSGYETVRLSYKGLECTCPVSVYDSADIINNDEDSDGSPSMCSTITLSFKQKNVMTRQAFRGTLTVNNGNESTAMKDVKINLEVRDEAGNLTTSHEFQIDAESLDGFTGDLDFSSGWTLEGGKTGIATILFVPTKYAAPAEPKNYSFGGSFSYNDPYSGLLVTRELNPITLTVNPSPNLELTYFMQRDVFGDDPLTEEVEPMIPSEFALIVNNRGYGDAENMNLTTQQPEIIDNKKNLAINFEIISTQLNGEDKSLALGGSVTSEFGTIPALSQAYAQWWLQSSLLGHFIEYDVKSAHLTSRNNPDLSLLDTVTVHELIHGFTLKTEEDKILRGFLVNDIKDRKDLPDIIYFTNATQQEVYLATSVNMTKKGENIYELKINATEEAGWYYGSLLDPTFGKATLTKITCSDGTEINVDNMWQTDRTLRDGKDPLYENRLHFVCNLPTEGETFQLTFEPKPELELSVESFIGVPEEGSVLNEPLNSLNVKFNKPVKTETFTSEDITLSCEGKNQNASLITVEKLSEQEYQLNLNETSLSDGYYVLTVQTSGIEDEDGFTGATGKQATWLQYEGGKVDLIVKASPAEGGSATPGTGRFDYDSDVTLSATETEGYEFVEWLQDGQTISDEQEFTYHLVSNTELTAVFSIKNYKVDFDCNEEQGIIAGASTGIYNHGTQFELQATPKEGFLFEAWTVNGEIVGEEPILTLTIDGAMKVEALFAKEILYDLGDANGDNSIDVGDISAIVNYIQQKAPANFVEEVADANSDGDIDVGDITAIVNLIVEAANNTSVQARAMNVLSDAVSAPDIAKMNNVIFMPPVTIQPGEKLQASIMMNNTSSICGYQFEIKLPEGITIPKDEDGFYSAELSTERTSAKKHSIFEVAKLTNGNYIVICSSTSNATFQNNNGEVAKLTLAANADLPQGTYEVQLADVRMSDTEASVDHVGNITAYAIGQQYARNVSADWGTLALPYATQSTEEVQLYQLAAADLSNGVLMVKPTENIDANRPCLFKRLNSEAQTVSFPVASNGVAKDVTVSAETGVDDWTFMGTYYNRTLVPVAAANIYYISNNHFWFANEAFEVSAFRGWFETAIAAVGRFRIVVSEDDVTAIEDLNESDNAGVVYDLQGRKRQYAKSGDILIVNNKKQVVK